MPCRASIIAPNNHGWLSAQLWCTVVPMALALSMAALISMPHPARAQTTNNNTPILIQNSDNVTAVLTDPSTTGSSRIDCGLDASCAPLNRNACNETTAREIAFDVTVSTAFTGGPFRAWFTTLSDCETENVPALFKGVQTANIPGTLFNFPEDYNTTFTTADLLGQGNLTGMDDACTTDGIERTYRLCFGANVVGDSTSTVGALAHVTFRVDTRAPSAPTLTSVSALDGRLELNGELATDPGDIGQWQARIRPLPDTVDLADSSTITSCDQWTDFTSSEARTDSSTISIEVRADNGTEYEACLLVHDAFGNAGGASNHLSATPRDECDIIECLPPGLKGGFCGTATGPWWTALAGLSALWFVGWRPRRRRKGQPRRHGPTTKHMVAVLVAAAAGAAALGLPARAQAAGPLILDDTKSLDHEEAPKRVTQDPRFTFEFRLGPYRPRFSSRAEARAVYSKIFASENDSLFRHQPLMKGIEFDWYPTYWYGLWGIGGRVSHWKVSGPTRVCSEGDRTVACTHETVLDSQPGNDTTSLTVLPLSLFGVYRMDLLHRRYSVPLIFYVKAGIDYHIWWASAGGKRAKSDNLNGQGGTWGFSGSGGMALNLDWIDPDTAGKAARIGMAGSHVFFEVQQIMGDGFGDDKRLNFSDTHYLMGLSLDFF